MAAADDWEVAGRDGMRGVEGCTVMHIDDRCGSAIHVRTLTLHFWEVASASCMICNPLSVYVVICRCLASQIASQNKSGFCLSLSGAR